MRKRGRTTYRIISYFSLFFFLSMMGIMNGRTDMSIFKLLLLISHWTRRLSSFSYSIRTLNNRLLNYDMKGQGNIK